MRFRNVLSPLFMVLAAISMQSLHAQVYDGDVTFENFKCVAPNSELDHFVGKSVAVDGNWAVVCEPNKAIAGVFSVGAINFYERTEGGWMFRQSVTPNDSQASDQVGRSVSISGTTAVVGVPAHVNGVISSGAVYTFELHSGVWAEAQKIVLRQEHIEFGLSVALDDNSLLVGAPRADYMGPDWGAAFLFQRNAGVWSLVQALMPTGFNPSVEDHLRFGITVALDGNVATVSTVRTTWGWPITYQDGQVVVYERVGTQWVETAKLVNPIPAYPGDFTSDFGHAVSISEDRIAIGAPRSTDWAHQIPGSVSLFEKQTFGSWDHIESVGSSAPFFTNTTGTDMFGASVSLLGDKLLVGAETAKRLPFEPVGTGQAYLFEIDEFGDWQETRVFRSRERNGYVGSFGEAVALTESYAVVGDSDADGPSGVRSGAAFIYELNQGVSYCSGPVNSTGNVGELTLTGSVEAADGLVTARATGLPAGQIGLLLAAKNSGFIDSPGGSLGDLCIGGPFARVGVAIADSNGKLALNVDTSAVAMNPSVPILPGEQWFFQLWYRDHHMGSTSNLSNGVRVDFN